MSDRQNQDHRKLGRALKLFDSYDELGPGLPIWLPDGAVIRKQIEDYAYGLECRAGYQHVYSPVLAKRELYEQSGHWEHYHDDMFPPMRVGGDEVVLRPMMCPHHVLVYKSERRSYRQLPLRIGEIGGQYRNELSGSLGGFSRVRAMALNDGHLFCREDQLEDEIAVSLQLILEASKVLGIEIARFRLSMRGDGNKYVDNPPLWEKSQSILRKVASGFDVPFVEAPNEAAFYGPKIDVQVVDAGGREVSWTTVQLDFLLPERFELSYVGADGAQHRPVMVHRSIVGGLERVVAYLIERWQGAFPVWLSPVQVVVLPVSARHAQAAYDFNNELLQRDLRGRVDDSDESLGERIRRAHSLKAPFVAVIGDNEVAESSISIRNRRGERMSGESRELFVRRVQQLAMSRSDQS